MGTSEFQAEKGLLITEAPAWKWETQIDLKSILLTDQGARLLKANGEEKVFVILSSDKMLQTFWQHFVTSFAPRDGGYST